MRKLLALCAMFGVVFVSVLTTSPSARADGLRMAADGPTMEEINVVREKIGDFMHALRGVNGSGISACEVKTGELFYKMSEADIAKSKFVNCLSITTSEQASKDALDVLFPLGSKFMGIFMPVEHIGEVVFQLQ